MTSPEHSAPPTRTLVTILYASAAVTVVVAIVLGLLVSPIMFAIALFAPIDLWIARAYASGRIGPSSDPGHAAEAAQADPSYNPYARED